MNVYTCDSKIKLLLAVNLKAATLYKIKNFKIIDKVAHYMPEPAHHRQELRIGRLNKPGVQVHFLDPKSEAKEIDREGFCRDVMRKINRYVFNVEKYFKGLVIIGGPKILGSIRPHYTKSLKDLDIIEIGKDIDPNNIEHLEKELVHELKTKWSAYS